MTINGKTIVATFRRDVSILRNGLVAVVFIGFAGLAVAAALYDLLSLRQY
jgi:hypothetical protein